MYIVNRIGTADIDMKRGNTKLPTAALDLSMKRESRNGCNIVLTNTPSFYSVRNIHTPNTFGAFAGATPTEHQHRQSASIGPPHPGTWPARRKTRGCR
eukprot:8615696-Pyramimonas_sp.AAC.1